MPINSATTTFTNAIATNLNTKYTSKISVSSDLTNSIEADFDKNYLYPLKLQQKTLKGGIFFVDPAGGFPLKYTTLINTRSPTSYFFLPTLAA